MALSELQKMPKLPPAALEKLVKMPTTLGVAEPELDSGPKVCLAFGAKVTLPPVFTDREINGFAATSSAFNGSSVLPKDRNVDAIARPDWVFVPLLVNVSCCVLKPESEKATAVRVPKLLLNSPKAPVWLMSSVGCNGLVKLKVWTSALALSARAVPATNTASDFMGVSNFWSAGLRDITR